MKGPNSPLQCHMRKFNRPAWSSELKCEMKVFSSDDSVPKQKINFLHPSVYDPSPSLVGEIMKFFHKCGWKVRSSCEGCWRGTECLEGQEAAWPLGPHYHCHPQHPFQALLRDPLLGNFFTWMRFRLC